MKDKQPTFTIVIDDDSDELKPVDSYVKEGHAVGYGTESSYGTDTDITLVNVRAKKRSIKIEIT